MTAARFIILAAPRTGSNLLCTLLNGHPEILCHHEVLNPQGIFVALDRRGSLDLGTVEERDADPLAFLERVWRTPGRHRFIGFKMTRGQSAAVMAESLRDPEVLKIVLRRENRLKTYVSTLIAEETGRWEVYSRSELAADRPRVRVEPEELEAHARGNDEFYAAIRRTLESGRQDCLELRYEDLLSPAEHRRLLGFLGASEARLEPASVKQNPGDLRRLILNFSELDARLRGTPFHAELHDRGS